MESLLASYGSEEEEGEELQQPNNNNKKAKFSSPSSSPSDLSFRVSDKPPSLFASLPPPNVGSKRVVEFHPPFIPSLLEDPDDQDHRPFKRRLPETAHGEKRSGLAALLPRPKNLGTILGGGGASAGGGRRSTLEMSSDGAVDNPAPVAETGTLETSPSLGNSSVSLDVSSGIGTWKGYGEVSQTNADAYTIPSAGQTGDVYGYNYHSGFVAHEAGGAFATEGHIGVPDYQREGQSQQSAFNGSYEESINDSKTEDPLASIMMKEKRRGSKAAPPNLIEVKQADLTATKVREDQLRTTGIAFGPAYKPVSSNKDKPSKLHRRKHQIGSLYFDMKQKEMELLERRVKGTMTKSQTQAKYGW